MSGVLTAMFLCSSMFGTGVAQGSSDCATTPLPSGSDIVVNGTILRSPVTSRGFYPPNTDAFWNVIAPNDYYINIEFLCSFGLGPGFDDLCYDYIKIKPANGSEQTFCVKMPEPVLIAGSSATIYFHSDLVLQDVGFVAEITFVSNDTRVSPVECTSTDIQTNFDGGIIVRSPVLKASSRSYPANTDFSSNVMAPNGYFLRLEFICAFGIQGTDRSCNDYVQLTSSPIDFDEIYCGESPPDPFIVQSNELSIKFHSDMYLEDVGFVLKITYVKSSEDLTTTSNTDNDNAGSVDTTSFATDSSSSTTSATRTTTAAADGDFATTSALTTTSNTANDNAGRVDTTSFATDSSSSMTSATRTTTAAADGDFTTTSSTSGTTAKSVGLILAGVSAFTVLLTLFFKYF